MNSEPTPSSIAARLIEAEIIPRLQADFGLADILEIGDALLASPVLAWEIDVELRHGLEAIGELRQQAGSLMLIGASGVETPAQLEAALSAGAQFMTASRFEPTVWAEAQAANAIYVPTVFGQSAARSALAQGCRFLTVTGLFPAQLRQLGRMHPEAILFIGSGVTLTNLAAYVEVGVDVFQVNEITVGLSPLSMAEVITNARRWRAAWKQAQALAKRQA